MGGLRKEMGGLRKQMGGLRKEMGGAQTYLDSLCDAHLRAEVAKQFGQDYSRQLTATSVWDFITLLFDGATQSPAVMTDVRPLIEMASRITAKLVDEQIPARLLEAIHRRLEVGML